MSSKVLCSALFLPEKIISYLFQETKKGKGPELE